MKLPRIGVAGVGARGTTFLEEPVRTGTGVVVAFADPYPPSLDEARKLAPEARAFDDWREMLEKTDMDILAVGAPQYVHRDIAVAGLTAGLDVYCEKPLAPNIEECDEIVEAVRASKSFFYVGYQLPTMPVYKHIFDLVGGGLSGPRASCSIGNCAGRSGPRWTTG